MDTFIIKNTDPTLINALFRQHEMALQKAFTGVTVDIQHVGATSVKGLLSKGDMDIQVRVEEKDFENAKTILGQHYVTAQDDKWSETFASFRDSKGEIPVGVQLTVKGSQDDKYFYELRDFLNNNPSVVKLFNELKQKLNGKPIEEYRMAKSQFIQEFFKQQ